MRLAQSLAEGSNQNCGTVEESHRNAAKSRVRQEAGNYAGVPQAIWNDGTPGWLFVVVPVVQVFFEGFGGPVPVENMGREFVIEHFQRSHKA